MRLIGNFLGRGATWSRLAGACGARLGCMCWWAAARCNSTCTLQLRHTMPAPTPGPLSLLAAGKIPTLAAYAYHRASGRKPAPPNQKLGYAEVI